MKWHISRDFKAASSPLVSFIIRRRGKAIGMPDLRKLNPFHRRSSGNLPPKAVNDAN